MDMLMRRRAMMAQSTGGGGSLPAGYTAVTALRVDTGSPYIKCGDIINQNVKGFEVEFMPAGVTAEHWQAVFGGATSFSVSFSLWINDTSQNIGAGAGGMSGDSFYHYGTDEQLTAKALNDVLYINGNVVNSHYPISSPDSNWQWVILYSRWQQGNPSNQNYVGWIYYAKFWDANEILLFDGVPCRRDGDGVFGFYDYISASFIAPTNGTLTPMPL